MENQNRIDFVNDDYEILQKGYRLMILLKSGLFIPSTQLYPTFDIAQSFAEKIKNGEVPLAYERDGNSMVISPEMVIDVQIYGETLIRQIIPLNRPNRKKIKLGFATPSDKPPNKQGG